MNKHILQKLILSLMLFSSMCTVHPMKFSSPKHKFMINSLELETIKSHIKNSQSVFVSAEILIPKLESIILHKRFQDNANSDQFIKSSIEQCAQWLIEKIVQDKLLEFKENDPIRVLFDKGIIVLENLIISEESTINALDTRACGLADLPNELLLKILLKGIDECFYLKPINLAEIKKSNNFLKKPFSIFQAQGAHEKKIQEALNAQLLSATRNAIKFIANIMMLNKVFYSFAGEFLNYLKAKISHELLHEKLLDLLMSQKNFDLLNLMLKAKQVDVNYKLERWGCEELNFFKFLISKAINKRKQGLSRYNIKQIIKMFIDHGVNLTDNDDSLFTFPVTERDEDLAVFLLVNATSMAHNKELLHYALLYDMQQLVKVMLENGAIIELEDLQKVDSNKKHFLNQVKSNSEQVIKSNVCTIS